MASFTQNMPASEEHGQPEDTVKEIPAIFNLANGFVEFTRIKGDMSDEGQQKPDYGYFSFSNHNMATPLRLYCKQMHTLVQHLQEAYYALNKGDTSYCLVIGINKVQRITLQVSAYNDKYYLFLKKCFKPQDKADDPKQDWIHTRSSILFDPEKDDPIELLKFTLSCYRKNV